MILPTILLDIRWKNPVARRGLELACAFLLVVALARRRSSSNLQSLVQNNSQFSENQQKRR